ncbi:MAG TPA: recombinase family protein [Ktedonobacteraceae bacterium]|nr:recombinase family protein [Ktedonobacteraceae bacterium]
MLFADRAAIYVRQSSEEPATSQAERLDAYARGQGYQIADQHYYRESRAEGTPAFASDVFYAMMKAAARGEFAAIFVTTASRITRDSAELETIKSELERVKVALITVDDGVTVVVREGRTATEGATGYIQRFILPRFARRKG